MKGRHPWVRVALLAALAYASTAGVAGAQESVAFDLPEQSLEESLRALGKSGNLNILIDRSLVAGLRAPALKTTMTIEQALDWLLRNTGLAHEFVDEHTVVLMPAVTSDNQSQGAASTRSQSKNLQDAGMDAPDHEPGLVDAITVTASKLRTLDQVAATGSRLGLTQRQIPATLDVVDADQITARGLHSVKMAVDTLPGVSTGGSPGDPVELSMRGFTGGQVMVLFDGIHIGPSVVVNRPGNSFNLEKVEVLKGPASVLYGQGAVGGVVNTVSKLPRFERGRVDVLATYGSRGRINLGVGAGTALNDTIAVRADVARTSSDGYVKGLPENALDVAASMRWRPDARLDVIFKLDYLDDDPSPYFGTPLLPKSVATQPMDVVRSSRGYVIDERTRDINYNVADYRLEATQLWPKVFVTWSPAADLTFKAHAYYFHAERTWMNSETYVFNPATQLVDRDRFVITHDQDLLGAQASVSRTGKWFGRDTTLLVGTEYTDFDFHRRRGVTAGDSVDPFDPQRGTFGTVPARALPTFWRTWAVFAENVMHFTPDLALVSGLRYDSFALERRNLQSETSPEASTDFERTYTSVTGRLGLIYDLSPRLSSYASFSLGADPPVPVSILSLNAREKEFDVAESYQGELGIKGNTAGNAADFTLSAYYIKRQNIVTLQHSSVVSNIGDQTARGIEATANIKLTDRWTLSANAAYTLSKFGMFIDARGVDASGHRAPNVPEWMGNVWMSIKNVAQLPLEVGGGIRYLGDRYGDNANTLVLEDYTLVTLYAAWAVSDRVLVSARAKNVFDEAYANWADLFYPGQVLLGEPRSFEIELVAKF